MKNKRTKKILNRVQTALLTLTVFGAMIACMVDAFFNSAHTGIIALVAFILFAIAVYMQHFINKL